MQNEKLRDASQQNYSYLRLDLENVTMSAKQDTTERCSGCGLLGRGGTSGCQAMMDELLARDFSNVTYFRYHRMFVDIYSLQHPDRYCISAKSLAAHLTGLCWFIVNDGSRAVGSESLRQWLNGAPRIEKPEIPSFRGELTIAAVLDAPDPTAYGQAVRTLGAINVGGLLHTAFVGSPMDSGGTRWTREMKALIFKYV